MTEVAIHKTRGGLNGTYISLCGESTHRPAHADTCGYPRRLCNCQIDVDCAACAAEMKARRERKAEAAKAALVTKEEKLNKLAEPQIFD